MSCKPARVQRLLVFDYPPDTTNEPNFPAVAAKLAQVGTFIVQGMKPLSQKFEAACKYIGHYQVEKEL